MNKGKQPTSASTKKTTSTSAKRKKPPDSSSDSSPDSSPELSPEEEEDYLTRLCSIRIKRFFQGQFEIKIFNINHDIQFEIIDARSSDSLVTIDNTGSFVYALLIKINNNNRNGIRFNYNGHSVELLHFHISLNTQGYNKGYVGTDANGNLTLRIIHTNPQNSIVH
ncbi:1629_t:CDS:1 [Gigaspora rosea]|nr:1629_t:CDS:1 [Gigaspora rosea]